LNRSTLKLILLFILLSSVLVAQNSYINRYSGAIGQYNSAVAFKMLPDGGYGIANSNSFEDDQFLKISPTGQLQAMMHYANTTSYYDGVHIRDFLVLADSSLLFAIRLLGTGGGSVLMKTNMYGEVISGKKIGSSSLFDDVFFLQRSNGSSYMFMERSNPDLCIGSISAAGIVAPSTINCDNIINPSITITSSLIDDDNPVVAYHKNYDFAGLLKLDTALNVVFSMGYPNISTIVDVATAGEGGYICLVRDTLLGVETTFSVMKTDSLGIPEWRIMFSDSLKIFDPETIHRNNDGSYFCFVRWLNINHTLWNYDTAILHLDDDGTVIGIRDSLEIQSTTDLVRTAGGRYSLLIQQGSSNNNAPAILFTDTLFTEQVGYCYNKQSSSITSVPAPILYIADSFMVSSGTNLTNQNITILDSVMQSTLTQSCFPTGSCVTKYSAQTITACSEYTSPSGNQTWYTGGIYKDTIPTYLGCDSIITINLTITLGANAVIAGDSLLCTGQSTVLSTTAVYPAYLWSNGSTSQSITVSATGNYSVIVSGAAGCTDTASFFVTVLPYPVVSITAQGPTSFCHGDSVILAAPPGLTTYQWYRWDNLIPGASSVNYSAKTRGRYKCIAKNAALCADTSNIIQVYVPCLPAGPNHERIEQLNETKTQLLIYPNPGTGYFSIESPAGQLEVFNSTGSLVYTDAITASGYQLDISSLSEGMYFVKVNTTEGVFREKILLSHEQ